MTPPAAPAATTRTRAAVPHRLVTTLWTLGVPLAVAVAGVALADSWRAELPDPVATHFGPGGRPDGFGALTPHVVAPAVIVVAFGAFMWVVGALAGHTSHVRRMAAGFAVWFAVVIMGTVVGSLAGQRGLADAAQAPSVSGTIGAVFAAATVAAVLAAWATPADRHQPTTRPLPDDAAVLDLRPGEHAIWVRRTGNRAIGTIAVGLFVLLVAVAVLSAVWWLVGVGAGVALILLAAVRWTTVVDHDGLTVRSVLRRPRLRVPLDEVVRASTTAVSPLRDYGGWGLRVGRRGRVGVVVRQGEALLVERTGGRELVVTVDDAATGAALLNTLAGRGRG